MKGDLEGVLPLEFEELGAAHCSRFRIGGVSVEVAGDRDSDVALVPSLLPFRVEAGVSEINIQVKWADSLTPRAGRQLFDSGTTWRVYEDEAGFQFDFNSPVFGKRPYKRLHVDKRFRHAALHMSEESFAGFPNVAEPLEYPLDELLIMHRLTQEQAVELHSCGIVSSDGTGNLFVGHSGAGKSTTTRLWTSQQDVDILSDDRIIVRRNLDRTQVKQGGMRMHGTPWHGEAMYASPGSAPLSRVYMLQHVEGNIVTRLSPSQAVAELFARSFVPFHRHEYVDSALEFLQELVGAVPVYHYAFEPNEAAVERILKFCA